MNENQSKYNVVYAGAIASGFSEEQVKTGFVAQMNIPEDKVERLLSGKSITLKKALTQKQSQIWQQKLLNIGAEVAIIPFIDDALLLEKSINTEANSKLERATKESLKESSQNSISNVGNNQVEYDEEMKQKIQSAKIMMANQPLEQQRTEKKESRLGKKLMSLTIITMVIIVGLYFYADSMI
jgi:hypothetical protein